VSVDFAQNETTAMAAPLLRRPPDRAERLRGRRNRLLGEEGVMSAVRHSLAVAAAIGVASVMSSGGDRLSEDGFGAATPPNGASAVELAWNSAG
jgi:hypothetical protein